jgi:Flp pilus assembly protein TadB
MLVGGVLLALCGLRWVQRLVPVPAQSDDPVAVVADVLASLLGAGIGLRMALDRLAPQVPPEILGSFCRARRTVTLGATWPEALSASDDCDLRRLGQVVQDAQSLGAPVMNALDRFADELRAARTLSFDAQMRRAPVLMVLPLVLCVLPSFLLLALGPFIRGLSLS